MLWRNSHFETLLSYSFDAKSTFLSTSGYFQEGSSNYDQNQKKPDDSSFTTKVVLNSPFDVKNFYGNFDSL